jgi:type III secretion protein V
MLFRRAKDLVLFITRNNDILLAVLVVAIISLIVLPLPTALMDTFIAANLGISISLLMLSTYIPNSIALSTFPTLLLLATLFRLSLNIASTRLILLDADAGRIIDTFGNFVVAGNFVVGTVVFLIITIVQFLVIAKGSERVAEVAARFTLDAMPGKQMSIDADLRAGIIDISEAKKRRKLIQLESSLYGAMDGAMKFVKGDAIAGLIVTVINILAGICIGILQKGMPMAKAIQTYSVLTIGDGLVAQIPALLISITAGIIITRSSDAKMPHLGGEIGFQVLSQPKSLLISGLIICSFSIVPGFPVIQFLCIGGLIFILGLIFYIGFKKSAEHNSDPNDYLFKRISNSNGNEMENENSLIKTIPLQIDLDAGTEQQIDHIRLNNELIQVRRALYQDIGILFPKINLNITNSMAEGKYTILMHEVPISQGRIFPGHVIVMESEATLSLLGIETLFDKPFLSEDPTLWVPYKYRRDLEKTNIKYLEATKIISYHVMSVLKNNAAEFVGLQETKFLINVMEKKYPDLVQEMLKVLSISQITNVLKRLVEEEVSIKNLKHIFHYLIEWGQKEKDVILLTEYIRVELKRYISYRYSAGKNTLSVYMFDRQLEEEIRNAIRKTSGTSYLVLGPEKSKHILDAIKNEIGMSNGNSPKPILLTSMDIRRYVKKFIEPEIKHLPVLSYQELSSEILIQPLGRIQLQS